MDNSGYMKINHGLIFDDDKSNIFKFADEYMYFLNHSKTAKLLILH